MTAPVRDTLFGSNGAVAWHPGRLWSLWDIMKSFRAKEFMLIAKGAGLADVFLMFDRRFPNDQVTGLEERVIRDFENNAVSVENDFIELELTASLATLRKIQTVTQEGKGTRETLNAILSLQAELHGRLVDEMQGKLFWTLNIKEAEWYKNPRKGWEEIIERFPDALSDIEEASKCIALSRYAAAIFHSVQVVEVGLIGLGKLIGVTDPLSGWTATTNHLHSIIKKGHEARTLFERQHFAFLEQMHGTVEGLKNAWRNKISHAHGKLTLLSSDFSPEIAEEILFATRAFMRRLATDAPVASAA
jgi:hypothetical protein